MSATVDYFSQNCPEYSVARVAHAVEVIGRIARPQTRFADVGCGAGNVLAHIAEVTALRHLTGFDPAPEMVELTRERVAGPAEVLSVLDESAVSGHRERFDLVLLAAVLHHLVAGSRRSSRSLARAGLANTWSMVAPGGTLVVVEPTFEPKWAAGALFYLKRIVTRFTDRRIAVGGQWNNIGAPVVSFFTAGELEAMVERLPGAELVEVDKRPTSLPRLVRALGIRSRADTTLVVRKAG